MSNKNKKKVKQFTGKHKLDKYLTKEEIKKIGPGNIDLLLDLKNQMKKSSGGYTVTNRYSDIMLPGKKRTTRIT